MLNHLVGVVSLFLASHLHAQQDLEYPYPLKFHSLSIEQARYKMAYMDVPSEKPNGKTIILFHGKNFNGYYWKDVIPFLNGLGYRVIVPDQLGFGESDKPDIHYSFHQMASNSMNLLDSLHISRVTVLGHSMGGMLAVRFVLMYASNVDALLLENPIGLEDYKTFVPYTPLDSLYKQELLASYESYKKYQETYYPVWKPAYEPLVKVQAKFLGTPEFPHIAWANSLTFQMIYEQPVCYEYGRSENLAHHWN
jgi:pimeloyl-ACP methyl ester carboxylesterase